MTTQTDNKINERFFIISQKYHFLNSPQFIYNKNRITIIIYLFQLRRNSYIALFFIQMQLIGSEQLNQTITLRTSPYRKILIALGSEHSVKQISISQCPDISRLRTLLCQYLPCLLMDRSNIIPRIISATEIIIGRSFKHIRHKNVIILSKLSFQRTKISGIQ